MVRSNKRGPLTPQEQEKRTHKVVSGDNLANIAKAYKTSVDKLVAVNQYQYPKITSGSVKDGWELTIV